MPARLADDLMSDSWSELAGLEQNVLRRSEQAVKHG